VLVKKTELDYNGAGDSLTSFGLWAVSGAESAMAWTVVSDTL
jgi:hypothetical protein